MLIVNSVAQLSISLKIPSIRFLIRTLLSSILPRLLFTMAFSYMFSDRIANAITGIIANGKYKYVIFLLIERFEN